MDFSVSEKLFEQIRHCMNCVQRGRFQPREEPVWQELGRAQARVLCVLLEADGMPLKELAAQLQIRPASIGELVDKLEQNGYVERRGNENDKRIFNIYLQEKGRSVAEKIINSRQEAVDSWCSGLSEDEKNQLSDLLSKLIASMEKKLSEAAEEPGGRGGHFGHGHPMDEGGDGRPDGFWGRGWGGGR